MGDSTGAWFRGAIGIGVLAAGLGVGYYFGIYLPNRDQTRGAAVATCLKGAVDQYSADWESQCQQLKLGKNCKLPRMFAKEIDERSQHLRDECPRIIP